MSFKNIKGQDRAVSFLKRAVESDKHSHAYIFFGPDGVGKKLAAVNFAKALNCAADIGKRPCDQCVSCKKIDASNHPDVMVVVPDKEGATLKIDKVRELIRSIGLKPYEGRRKAYIIDKADSMTPEAQNALLKTLEEPPSESVLILITEKLDGLLSTIASRSQVVKFFPLAVDEVKTILISEHNVDGLKAHILANLSCGRLGEALKYKNEDFFNKRLRIVQALADRTLFDSEFENISRSDLRIYLDIMLLWYRDVLVAKTGSAGAADLINADRKDAILFEAGRVEFEELDNIIKQIISTNSFLDQNVNPRLAIAALELSMMRG